MAFAFWRCSAEFSLSPKQIMEMPIYMFWSMCRNIDRVRAERDLRTLNIFLAASAAVQGSSEMLDEVKKNLIQSVGLTVRMKEQLTSKEDIMRIIKG